MQITWSNEIQEKLERRKLQTFNRTNETKQITRNQTIIDYAKICAEQNQYSEMRMHSINQV